mgnify:FL=1
MNKIMARTKKQTQNENPKALQNNEAMRTLVWELGGDLESSLSFITSERSRDQFTVSGLER